MRRLGNAATVLARIVPTLTRLWQGLYTAPFIEVDEALSPHKGTWPMKSERRHELQHNALADWLVKAGETTKPYQNIMLASIVLVVVALAAYSWMSRESSAQTTQAWDDLNTALDSGNPMELAQVREDHPDTSVAHMATVILADYRLASGCSGLFKSKAPAQQELSKAVELYRSVLRKSREPSLLQRATFGLARAKESKGTAEDLKEAMQSYEEVATKWPDGAYAAAAAERLEDLKRPVMKQFYDDLRKFDPKPAFSGGSGKPAKPLPFEMDSLPSDGPVETPKTSLDLNFEDLGGDKVQTEEKKDEKAAETPAPSNETKPPAEEKVPEKNDK